MKKKITIVTFPTKGSAMAPLSNLIDIMSNFSSELNLITGNMGYKMFNGKVDQCYKTEHKTGNIMDRILSYILVELKISHYLFKLRNKTTLTLFMGGDTLLLPMLTAKILNKRILLNCGASSYLIYKSSKSNLSKLIEFLSSICYNLTDIIILYTPNLIKEWNLEKFNNKISIAHEHHLDLNEFKIKKKLEEREYDIGYIGRLSPEKGIIEFIESIPELLKMDKDLKFLIGGDGPLKEEVKEYLEKNNLEENVDFIGWIPRDELPNYLNQIKIITLPSYTEGLPYIMLEAMACGTLVLATSVGSIPYIIEDGKTGFIFENTSKGYIIKDIQRILKFYSFDKIVENAYDLVNDKFEYNSTIKTWKKVINE